MKIKYLLVLLPILIFLSFSYVFAEGDTICKAIAGETEYEVNAGIIDYDAHQLAGDSMNLDVWQSEAGFFPDKIISAACAMQENGTWYDGEKNIPYTHSIRGWAGATNLGFIIHHCSDLGLTNTGWHLDFPCFPKIDFGLYVTPKDENNIRKLIGHVWSPVVGYMKAFVTLSEEKYEEEEEDEDDQIIVVSSGYFISQAGTKIPYDGIRYNLEGNLKIQVDEGTHYCAGKTGFCLELRPSPRKHTAIANGVDGYFLYIWVRDDNGQDLSVEAKNEIAQSINIRWKNTVKLDHYDKNSEPAVPYLPTGIEDFDDCNNPNNNNDQCNDESAPDYVLKEKIISYAPTDGALRSSVFSATPRYEIQNRLILENISENILEVNILKLEYLAHGPYILDDKELLKASQVHANGIPKINIDFKPPVLLDGHVSWEDKFKAFPGVAENLHMIYTQEEEGYQDVNVSWELGSSENCNFTLYGEDIVKGLYDTNLLESDIQVISTKLQNEDGSEIEGECKPSFLSKISLKQGGNKVSYPGFGIPKVFQEEENNPQIIIRGDITGAVLDESFVEYFHGATVMNVNKARNIIMKNIARFIENPENISSEKVCTVTALNNDEPIIDGCNKDEDYLYTKVAGQHIVYSSGATFIFEKLEFNDHFTFIIKNASSYLQGNIVPGVLDSPEASFALIVFRDSDDSEADVYIGTCRNSVHRIEAAIFADRYITSNDYGWPTDQGFPTMQEEIRANSQCQIYFKGWLAGAITVGGSSSADYLVSGNREIFERPVNNETLLKIQAQDLNNLRSYMADLKIVERVGDFGIIERCPIDQYCGRPFCLDEQRRLDIGEKLCGEIRDEGIECTDQIACNGIDSTRIFIDATDAEIEEMGLNLRYFSREGDLEISTKNISPEDLPENIPLEAAFHSVYIEYKEPKSVIFHTN